MLTKKLYWFTSLLVVFAMLGAASPAFALTGTRTAKGKVIAINRRTHVMTVRTRLGTKVRLRFNSTTTRLWHNGTRIKLGRLHVGNSVTATFTPSLRGPGTANDVDDDNGQFNIEGTVAAVDTTANTLSIASHDGGSTVVLNIDANTVITRNGQPATLADLLFGDQVQAKYDSSTMLASLVQAEDEAQFSEVEGSITAIDMATGTVTISGEGDGSGGGDSTSSNTSNDGNTPMTVTVNVTTTTVIMFNDSPGTLANLAVGMQAEAKYDPTTMNASFLEAESE